MLSFMLCLILSFVIAFGGREQKIVAQFSDELQRSAPLLVTGIVCAVISASMMAYAGSHLAAMLPPRAAEMLVAMALAIAAVELCWRVPVTRMKEPTRSLVAIGIVLFVRQIADAARFAIFACAAAMDFPTHALIGGAIGGGAAVALGWGMGLARLERLRPTYIRLGLACMLFAAALVIGMNARFQFL